MFEIERSCARFAVIWRAELATMEAVAFLIQRVESAPTEKVVVYVEPMYGYASFQAAKPMQGPFHVLFVVGAFCRTPEAHGSSSRKSLCQRGC